MFDLDKWQEIYHSIKQHKLRTVLTAFGVFWGIFMLMILLGSGKAFQNGVMKSFGGIATKGLFVWAEKTSIGYKGLKPGREIQLKNDDYTAIKNNISEIAYISPKMNLWGDFTVSYKTKNGAFGIQGVYAELMMMEPMIITTGRFLNETDTDEKRKVCVIGERVKEIFFPDTDPIGEYINIKGVYFKVVGVFKGKSTGWDAQEEQKRIYIPLTTLQVAFNQLNKIGWFGFVIKDDASTDVAKAKVKQLLMQRHIVDPKDDQAFGAANIEEEFNKVNGLFVGINLFIILVGAGTILAGIVGVSNIMLIVVKERTKEIGIRKALGATPGSIVALIIQESIVITLFSGYLGLLLGGGIIEGIGYMMIKFKVDLPFFSNPTIDFKVAITSVMLLVVSGALAGLIPAIKASSINPIEALKDE